MSETVDLTALAASLQGIEREVRLLRVQLDQVVGLTPARLSSIEARLGLWEAAVHAVAAEVARGFGEMQQRFDVMDAGLASLRTEVATSTATLLRALKGDA